MKTGKITLSALILIGLSGCSSTGNKAGGSNDADSTPTPVSQPTVHANGTSSGGAPPTSAPQQAKPVEINYKTLSQAVRSGDAQAISDETARILTLKPDDPIALNAVALMYVKRGKPGAAKIVLQRAIEKNPTVAALANNLGFILLDEGDVGAAIVQFKKALKSDPNNVDANANLGNVYASGGDWAHAKPYLELAVKAKAPSSATLLNYGVTQRIDKNYDGAYRAYNEVMSKDSRNLAALLNTAVLYIDYMNKREEGAALLRKVEILDSDRKDVQAKLNALEKRTKAEVK